MNFWEIPPPFLSYTSHTHTHINTAFLQFLLLFLMTTWKCVYISVTFIECCVSRNNSISYLSNCYNRGPRPIFYPFSLLIQGIAAPIILQGERNMGILGSSDYSWNGVSKWEGLEWLFNVAFRARGRCS